MCYPLGLRSCTPHTLPHLPASIPSSARHRQLRLDSTLLPLSHLHLPPSSVHFSLLVMVSSSSRHIFVVYFSQFCYSVLYGLSLFPSTKPSHFSFAYYCINLGEHEWPSLPSLISPSTTLNQETFPLSPTSMPTQQYCIPLHCIHDASRFSWSLMTDDGDDDGENGTDASGSRLGGRVDSDDRMNVNVNGGACICCGGVLSTRRRVMGWTSTDRAGWACSA